MRKRKRQQQRAALTNHLAEAEVARLIGTLFMLEETGHDGITDSEGNAITASEIRDLVALADSTLILRAKRLCGRFIQMASETIPDDAVPAPGVHPGEVMLKAFMAVAEGYVTGIEAELAR